MKVTIDVNVFIDVIQKRQPHYSASERILRQITSGTLKGVFPSHSIATLYYIVRKHISKIEAEQAVDDLLGQFELGTLQSEDWRTARSYAIDDLEDAAVAVAADLSGSTFIITRDIAGFTGSSVPAITPSDFLTLYPLSAPPAP